jgi:N-acetylmuramoyl-L-alanine amidase
LQSTLCRLGFDCGRVDGILGPRTQRALIDFQTNCGLVDDGVCGPTTVKALRSLSSYTGDGPGIAAVRESERLRDGFDSMTHCRIVVGQFGGLTPLVRAVAHALRDRGAAVMSLDEPDALAQAKAANLYGAHVYVGFESSPESVLSATFFQVPTFESVGGRALAEGIAVAIGEELTEPPEVLGMRLPILRETRMPAVLLTVGAPRVSATAAPAVVEAVVNALEVWARPPADGG